MGAGANFDGVVPLQPGLFEESSTDVDGFMSSAELLEGEMLAAVVSEGELVSLGSYLMRLLGLVGVVFARIRFGREKSTGCSDCEGDLADTSSLSIFT